MIKSFLESFRLASKLDILNLNYQYLSGSFNLDQFISRNNKRFSGPVFGLVWFCMHFIINIYRDAINKSDKLKGKRILCYANSLNQLNVIQSITEANPHALTLGTHKVKADSHFRLSFAYLMSFPFFFRLLSKYYSIDGYTKKMMRYQFNEILLTYGFFIKSYLMFKKCPEIAVMVISNDHLMRHRVLNYAAQLNGIKTIYIQHANVRENFPALVFDYAFLDGRDAFSKYCVRSKNISETKVVLTGNPKIDAFIERINLNREENIVGISCNTLDSVLEVNNLVCYLSKTKTYSLILRTHPRDTRKEEFREIALKNSVKFSDPHKQSVYEFFEEVNVLISGESSIHLEAAAVGIHPLYYYMGKYKELGFYDFYGFIQNGLVLNNLQSYKDLMNKIEAIYKNLYPYYSHEIGYYLENFRRGNNFSSKEKIKDLISDILNNDDINDFMSFKECK